MDTPPSQSPRTSRKVDFKAFGLPADEPLVEYYSCALWHEQIYRYGTMFISPEYICFDSVLMNGNIVMKFAQVSSIKKKKGEWLKAEAIEVTHFVNEKLEKTYFFSAFVNRDAVYVTLEQLWKVNMDSLLNIVEVAPEASRSSDSVRKAIPKNHLRQLIKESQFSEHPPGSLQNAGDMVSSSSWLTGSQEPSSALPPLIEDDKQPSSLFWIKLEASKDSNAQNVTSSTKYIMEKHTRNEIIYHKYRIPKEEPIVTDYRVHYYAKDNFQEGWLFVTPKFVLFGNINLKFVIPFQHICEISQSQRTNSSNIIEIITLNSKTFVFKAPQKEMPDILKQLVGLYSVASSPVAPITAPPVLWKSRSEIALGTEILSNPTQFSNTYTKSQERLEKWWHKYIEDHRIGDVGLIQQLEFHQMVLHGIPDGYRGQIWRICSGAVYKGICEKVGMHQLLKQHAGIVNIATDQIEKDLHRSLPEHPFYQTEKGISALRNVLVAYSFRNPVIGYCQAMNYVAAGLLLYMNQEDAFWCLASICEDIVPSNYRPQMIGSLLEQKIFEFLLGHFLPDLHEHFTKYDIPVGTISTHWFLCLFVGFVPLEVAVRVLDCWFCVGTAALYRVALAMFKVHKDILMSSTRVDQYAKIFRDAKYDAKTLLQIAWTDFARLPMERMNEIKNEHQYSLIQDLRLNAKGKKIRVLTNQTLFTKEELATIYDRYHELFSLKTVTEENKVEDTYLNLDVFEKIFPKIFPFWSDFDPMKISLLMKSIDADNDGRVTMDDIAKVLNNVYKGTLADQWTVCAKMHLSNTSDTLEQAQATQTDLYNILESLTRIYRVQRNKQGITFIGGQTTNNNSVSQYVSQLFQNYKINEPTTEPHSTTSTTTTTTTTTTITTADKSDVLGHVKETALLSQITRPLLEQVIEQFDLDRNNVSKTFQIVMAATWVSV